MSLVEPLQGTGREAEVLKRRIFDKMVANRLVRPRVGRLIPALLIGGTLVVVGWVNLYHYLKRVGRENPNLGNLVERFDRSLNAVSANDIQVEFTSLYGLLQTESQNALVQYPAFRECMSVLNEAAGLLAVANVAPGERRDKRIRSYLFHNLWLLNDFRHQMANEEDPIRRRKNSVILLHLDNLTRLLVEHGADLEYEDEFGEME